jgi:hypothetical protein
MAGKIIHTQYERGENHRHHNHEEEAQEDLPDGPHDVSVNVLKPLNVLVAVTDGPGNDTNDETQEKLVMVLQDDFP